MHSKALSKLSISNKKKTTSFKDYVFPNYIQILGLAISGTMIIKNFSPMKVAEYVFSF